MIALIDCRTSAITLDSLKNHGVEPVLMPPSPSLQTGVASHTDMLVFIGFGRLFCHTSYYESNNALIDNIIQLSGLSLSLSSEEWTNDYPRDVLFNACLIGNKLICNDKTVSRDVLRTACDSGIEIVNVSQGYTKCSICAVSDNAIITADKSIAKACQKVGMDVLLVSEGHISLPPYKFGFIGGTSGLCKDSVYFCGSLLTHHDGDRINEFCLKHGKKAVSLSNGDLQDVGSIFFVGE